MRILLLCFTLAVSFSGLAQDKNYASYFTSLNFGDTFTQGELQVVFAELVTDSRCPKSVNCIRAGEAKIGVDIYMRGEFIETRELIFPAEGTVSEKNNLMFVTNDIRLMAVALAPYPNYPDQLSETDYIVEIKVN
ncbi:MAG: hypothetical protein KJO49_03775 [Bacteroidia bacterium]|nr:hypothetical protein [Bacteroidia bacterium]MBT8268886.1 hypothetical protein [Bacteroidia bacterium]NNF81620.1 hypothetical protein [Flavobacteriaceae bacterium]NNK70886.1 hypothetical protein [Flavobacteriaceae bacterium]NNL81302.1 hypothetical protein [Flavobacteriaceae bacterium]